MPFGDPGGNFAGTGGYGGNFGGYGGASNQSGSGGYGGTGGWGGQFGAGGFTAGLTGAGGMNPNGIGNGSMYGSPGSPSLGTGWPARPGMNSANPTGGQLQAPSRLPGIAPPPPSTLPPAPPPIPQPPPGFDPKWPSAIGVPNAWGGLPTFSQYHPGWGGSENWGSAWGGTGAGGVNTNNPYNQGMGGLGMLNK